MERKKKEAVIKDVLNVNSGMHQRFVFHQVNACLSLYPISLNELYAQDPEYLCSVL